MPKYLTILNIIILIILSCDSSTINSNCNNCGEGLVDGYEYKIVTMDDVIESNILEINPSADLEKCVRYKIDNSGAFVEVEIVEDCCCTLYE